ncbi:MAG: thiolase family protein [Dehalococcoidia bacterium]|nr:MAG: thiolase family protein [bacterium]MCK6565735.1 thiolase family protein [Dehalococcoidia bacterium]MCL4231842.1 thiolase family protein [Dehalococcoidia bacterium]NUQ54254.1 thiolase family protein [Dehalococcoidia bacterium]RIL03362.1 MAG: thiolase [bacterium]
MREVAIVGVSMIKFGRYPDRDFSQLAAQAGLDALKDAGAQMKDIQALYSGNLYATSGSGQRVLQQMGQTGIPVVNVANACATGSTALREAFFAVASGAYDMVMAVGSEQMGKQGLLGSRGDPATSLEGRVGSYMMPAVFGMAGMEHAREYGTQTEHFALASVKNHWHSTMNPLAQYQKESPLDEVMNARMIAYPNTLLMCCPTGDGAAAAVVCSMEKARQFTTQPIKIAASVLTSDPFVDRGLTLPDINTLTRNAAKIAYEQSGIGPEDLSQVELHDCFATAELLHYENLGLCGDGEAGKHVASGAPWIGNKVPAKYQEDVEPFADKTYKPKSKAVVNASGGLLSKGHPLGATGVANVAEIVWHLRGQAGDRQVENSKAGLAHVIGLCSACTIHILTK